MGRWDFICLLICPRGTNAVKQHPRNGDVSFMLLLPEQVSREVWGFQFLNQKFFWLLGDIIIFSWRERGKTWSCIELEDIFLPSFFFFKISRLVMIPREAECLSHQSPTINPNKKMAGNSSAFLLFQLYLLYPSHSIPRSEADKSVALPLKIFNF